jgi:hypothetical protein
MNALKVEGPLPQLTGCEVRGLMRAHKRTIRGLAVQMNIAMKRVRHVREQGVRGTTFTQDWIEAITASPRRSIG